MGAFDSSEFVAAIADDILENGRGFIAPAFNPFEPTDAEREEQQRRRDTMFELRMMFSVTSPRAFSVLTGLDGGAGDDRPAVDPVRLYAACRVKVEPRVPLSYAGATWSFARYGWDCDVGLYEPVFVPREAI